MTYSAPFLLAKIIGIGYVTTIYFIIGIALAKLFDRVYGKFDKKEHEKSGRSLFHLGAEIVFHMFLISVLIYILRNIVERIPYPLDGIGTYQHSRLKELSSPPILSVVTVLFQKNFKDKTEYFVKKILA